MPQCVRLQEEAFVFTYLFSASPPRPSPRPGHSGSPAAPPTGAPGWAPAPAPLASGHRKAAGPRIWRRRGHLISPLPLSPRSSQGFQGRAWGSGRCGGTPVTRDAGRGPGGLFPRGKTSAAPKVRPSLAHGSRRLHQKPRRQKPPQHGLHSFPSLFRRLTACRGQALSCH